MTDTELTTKRGRRARRVVERKSRFQGWATSDADEIERRRRRAVQEPLEVEPLEPRQGLFGTFRVTSGSGAAYDVEIRSLSQRLNSCGCPDHRINGLGTCKHVEAVLAQLKERSDPGLEGPEELAPGRVEIFLDTTGEEPAVRILWPLRSHARSQLRELLEPFFGSDGTLLAEPTAAVPALARRLEEAPPRLRRRVRLSRHLGTWAEAEGRRAARGRAREAFAADLAAGKRTLDLLRLPLYLYQQEGVLHLAFTERALLGDDMGLGKTIQAIGACELLHRLRGVRRVLVVSPASLKAEWEEQIDKFTGLPATIVAGTRPARLKQYRKPAFFYLTNYEQILPDGEDIQRLVAPDVIILDEAQRIKNWRTKTAQAVKRLESRYAFVLTGTPLENRIDDIYSIVQFLDPAVFGPLFRFNRDFYDLDDRGRPMGYKNLGELHRRLKPILLRRRKEEVEDQLPGRTVNTYFVPMDAEQETRYEEYSARVAKLLSMARRRPLTPEEFDKLQKWLACMRMLCDSPYILDPECRVCPKLGELEEVLEEHLAEDGRKVLVFSEWERMLQLVRELAGEMGLTFAWHTGSVPQVQRRQEINRFKTDPECRLFLSTDSGSVGLNLQAASVVVNLDLPWNPSRLEQRIARAWRKHQSRSVQVIHLVTEGTIEHRMLHVLAGKQALAAGVLDGRGDLEELPMPSGRAVFIERLEEIMGAPVATPPEPGEAEEAVAEPAEPLERLRQDLVAELGEALLWLETREAAGEGQTVLAVVSRLDGPASRSQVEAALRRNLGDGGRGARLELLDRATFEAVQSLVAAGLVQHTPGSRRVLHRSPALSGAEPGQRRRRLDRAREAFDRGERQQRMASVLAGGGFPVEALPSLAEATDVALTCLAHLAGLPVDEGGELPRGVQEELHRAEAPVGELAVEAMALAGRLKGRSGEAPVPAEEEIGEWVEAGGRLFRRLEETLSRAALGAPAS